MNDQQVHEMYSVFCSGKCKSKSRSAHIGQKAYHQTDKGKSAGEDREKREPWCTVCGTLIGAATMGNTKEVPQKLKIELPYDPLILFVGIYPKEKKSLF